jgi:hypothetical protein
MAGADDNKIERSPSSEAIASGSGEHPPKNPQREDPPSPQRRVFFASFERERRAVSQDAIHTIRTRADLAHRLSDETMDPTAKAGLLEIASMLEADADTLEAARNLQPIAAPSDD